MKKLTKQEQLNQWLKEGGKIDPLMALEEFGISPTAYHRRIGDFRESHPNFKVMSEWVKSAKSRYKIHWAVPV